MGSTEGPWFSKHKVLSHLCHWCRRCWLLDFSCPKLHLVGDLDQLVEHIRTLYSSIGYQRLSAHGLKRFLVLPNMIALLMGFGGWTLMYICHEVRIRQPRSSTPTPVVSDSLAWWNPQGDVVSKARFQMFQNCQGGEHPKALGTWPSQSPCNASELPHRTSGSPGALQQTSPNDSCHTSDPPHATFCSQRLGP